MERDEIEDVKCREDQKLQVLLVQATSLATFSFEGFLKRLWGNLLAGICFLANCSHSPSCGCTKAFGISDHGH